MGSLENCPRCGRLFVKGIRSICQTCHQDIEKKFQLVYTFIRKRENREATMMEVVEATGVSEADITRFIKEGRLHLSQLPNITYPCELCGKGIRSGRICEGCHHGIQDDLEAQEREKEREKKAEDERQNRYRTYHSLQDRLK
ncbi:TIGR03826 family flagellar region protein [Bacillus piscicola]|uniref:TIGR03826 family flagellar region protein n=1 Tax=Bacillus piscicola TaxID=1632684 RepID=UPI0023DD7937|nr:TIGR03826 family flagellar region protein [Bacillus piscicola]